MKISKIYLDHEGLRMFVGLIDAAILDVLWKANRPMTMQAVHRQLAQRWHFNTIATIMYRMVKVGTLERLGKVHPTFIPITSTEDQFIDKCIMLTTERFRSEYPTSFSEVIQGYQQVIK